MNKKNASKRAASKQAASKQAASKQAASKQGERTTATNTPTRTPHEELAQEASEWDTRRQTPSGFVEDPSAVPRAQEAIAISIRMPNALLVLLKKFAEREGIGYQVLIKRWLDDRVRIERDRLRANRADQRLSMGRPRAPQFPLIDRDDAHGHYQSGELCM